MTVSDFQIKNDDFGNEFVTFFEGIIKTRQGGLHEKHRLIQPTMFLTDTSRCPVSIFKLYLSKRVSQIRPSGPLYLSIIHKPVSNLLWYENVSMGQHAINFIMKRRIKDSPLRNSDKKLTSRSARKTLVKILRRHYIPKSEITGITGHNFEAGLDAYDSGNKKQQHAVSNAIDTVKKCPVPFQQNLSKSRVVFSNDKQVKNPTFNFLESKQASPKSKNYHFHNCTVNFYNGENSVQHQNPSRRRKTCVM